MFCVERRIRTNGRKVGLYDLVDLPIYASSAGNFCPILDFGLPSFNFSAVVWLIRWWEALWDYGFYLFTWDFMCIVGLEEAASLSCDFIVLNFG